VPFFNPFHFDHGQGRIGQHKLLNLSDCTMKMQLSTSAFLCVLYIACSPCEGASGDAFTMINKVQTMCEVESMSLASKLSDNYNSLDEAAEKEDRMKHEFVAAHIGFGWDHALGTKVRANDRVSELQKVQIMLAADATVFASPSNVLFYRVEAGWMTLPHLRTMLRTTNGSTSMVI